MADAGRGFLKSQIVFTDQFFDIDRFRRSRVNSGDISLNIFKFHQ